MQGANAISEESIWSSFHVTGSQLVLAWFPLILAELCIELPSWKFMFYAVVLDGGKKSADDIHVSSYFLHIYSTHH